MRWLKMSKYFPDYNWQPIIYTPENPDPSVIDESLKDEIHPQTIELKTKIWEPYHLYRKISGKKKDEKFKAGYISEASSGNWKSKLSVFIRGNFLIPDPRKFWIKPSVKYLSEYLLSNNIEAIVTTGPPHSMHVIGLGLKNKFPDLKWIADFRDPWTDIDFYNKLRLTKLADKKHRKLEKKVLLKADHVVTVSPGCAKDIFKIANRKIEVVNNGFDPADFSFEVSQADRYFSISHFGAFNRDRNPLTLWKVLGKLSAKNDSFRQNLRIQLIGQTDKSVLNSIKEHNLQANLSLIDHLPHQKGLELLSSSQILLLPLNDAPNVKGILPGKMYEYLALQRPILAIGPTDADYAAIIHETKSGLCHNFNDEESITKTITEFFRRYQKGELNILSRSFEKYSRKSLAKKIIDLIEN